jgi:formate hydrogenlyase subunit 6/NADH:ubiquinone oxidoreductase subunit I
VAMLPERFRGLLEVDVLCCTGCQACERACPIGVIQLAIGKEAKLRFLERFDIDLGKCMYCGFCVEACPVDAQAEGDREVTHAIRFTPEFEGVSDDLTTLTYRYVRPGDRILVAKNKKGQIHPTPRRGERAREAKHAAAIANPILIARARALRAEGAASAVKPDTEALAKIPVPVPKPSPEGGAKEE